MVNQNVQQLLAEGSDLVHFAEQELTRANEDVVTFLACNNIKRAINNYLSAYIESNGLNTPHNPTPDNLLRMCQSLDKKFANLDFHALSCSHEKGANNFCLEVEHVQECLDLAYMTRNLVIDKIKI
ncbi:MAG: hypothetical protein HKN76_07880 [Saprospiraceae bacterium]|nr:hypothetical protein [Saprospiraceae bacterium]